MTRLRELQATTRRRYAKAFKADIVAQCQMAGASVARIARSHDLNANMVHRWIRELTVQMPIVSNNPSVNNNPILRHYCKRAHADCEGWCV